MTKRGLVVAATARDAIVRTALMADRSRQAYGDRITPDELISERDQLLARAVAWLQTGR